MENMFRFLDNCYYDMRTNRLVYAENDVAVIKGQKRSVLRQLIEAYPQAVSAKDLGDEAGCCDDDRLRKVILQLRQYPGIGQCLQNDYRGYILIRPDDMKADIFQGGNRSESNMPAEAHDIFIPRRGLCTLQNRTPSVSPYFVEEARADTFEALDNAFQDRPVAFLWGDGGIGKSEACKKWAINKKYDTIVFAQLNSDSGRGNIQSLIIDDSIFVLTEGFPSRFDRESKEAYFYRKLNKIKQVTDENTLIIIDNFDQADDSICELLGGPYHLLVTTRNDPRDYGFPVIRVNEIQNIEHLKEIFFRYLDGQREDIGRDDPFIEKIFALVANHTLAIEIIAKALKFSRETLQTIYEKMSDPSNHELIGHVKRKVGKKTPFEIIQLLFDLSSLKKDEDEDYDCFSQMLIFMATMPTKGIELRLLQSWSNDLLNEAINTLVKRSWLRQDKINGKQVVSMHPLIREVVWHDLKPSLDKVPTIISGFIKDDDVYVDGLYHKPKEIKDQYEQVALSLLAAFPLRDLEQFDFYSKTLRILRLCANAGAALSLANELKTRLETANQANSWRYGFVNYQLGTIHASLLRQRKYGIDYYAKALKLMEKHSKSDEEKMWLAFLYRDMASVDCQDRHLYTNQETKYVKTIQKYLDEGEKLTNELLAQGSKVSNLKIYRGTLFVWRSKLEIWHGNLEEASKLLDEAEKEFKKYQYANVVDKSAIADVRALICAKKGEYAREIDALKEASSAFWNGFREHHYASVERLLKLAKAYINNAYKSSAHEKDAFKTNLTNARGVLLQCKTVLSNMKQSEEDTVNQKFVKEAEALQKEISEML